jgi:Sugar (pentulose and hexulose) kinases
MSADQLLAIDNGTQSVRALIFDLHGKLIAKSRVVTEPYYSTQPGWAEQDPNVWWNAVCEACQKLWKMDGVDKGAIAGVAVTTQRSTLINVDEKGEPLRPAIHWLDQRRTPGQKPVGGIWGLLFKVAGMSETVGYLQAEAEANWVMKNQPEIWARTHKFLLLSGFLTFKLTGNFTDSIGNQAAYIPFDFKKLDWCSKGDWKWQAVPMQKELLPDLVPPTSLLGKVTPEAAAASGIPAGLPVIAAAADKACEVVGAGCVHPEIACISYGTTATINVTLKKYTEVIPLIPPYPSAVPGAYSLETQIFRGYWMVSWFKREFGMNEERLAAERGVETEELFDDLVNSVPAGSLGLMLQPYWSPGLKVPGPEAKGAVIGFGDVHTRAYFYRAMLEGLAYALREGMERTQKRTGIPIQELRVAGGGSQSPAAMQLTADIFGLPTTRPHVYEASGLGAAMDVAVGLKLLPDFDAAVKEMTHPGQGFEPIPENHKIYDELFNRVYCKMYDRLQPLYDEIRDITGYPPKNG